MLAPITHILPITAIQRERLLPVPGRVLVRRGQKVNPLDVIAEANLTPEHLLLDIARGLGLPAEKADRFVQCKEGEQLSEGDIVAGPVGIARRVVRAPRAGKVVLAGSGQVLLQVESRPFELKAGFSGSVIDLIEDRGALIETTGALIQGVWGNGRVDYGLLNVIARSAEDHLTADRLDISFRGSVVLGGYCGDGDAIVAGGELPLRGMILASMDATLIPIALKANYPIILTEGLGKIAMNSAAYKLLSTNARREVSVIAEPWERYGMTRPEIVIPLPASAALQPPAEADSFKPGQQVRIVRAPYKSQIGTLLGVYPGIAVLPNGLRTYAAEIRLESGETPLIPLANLEILK